MLVLSRRVGEEIVIDGSIRVVIVAVQGNKVRIGVEAPPNVPVDRLEIHERRPLARPSGSRPVRVAADPVCHGL
jgi:carbon storage regulator